MTAKNLSFCAFALSSGCKDRIINIIKKHFPEPPTLSWFDKFIFRKRFNALRYGYVFNPQINLYLYFGFSSEELEDILIELSNGNSKKCEIIFNKANRSINELMTNHGKCGTKFYKSMTAKNLITIFLSIQDIVD
ncbi:MAG: hypothetical protein CSA42_07825 [Gammaproteobacteria bacterium]|nr:MAG: hypothetical protein CSA42_07825 [Gammaproteobacteria bacterium]